MKKLCLTFIISLTMLLLLCACELKEGNTDAPDKEYIKASKSLSYDADSFSVANEYITDLNNDATDDTILLYTDAEMTEDGIVTRNDGDNWYLVIKDGSTGEFFELYNGYVQLGNVYFQVADYFKDGKPVPTVTFYETTGAGLKIMNFVFDGENGFAKEIIYDSSEKSDSGINLKYSTIPVY